MAGQGDYLSRRKGSPYWRLKFQYPTEHMRADVSFALGRPVKAVEDISLKTTDRREAEIIAAPRILEHKKAMLGCEPNQAIAGFVVL
jgi:hypothetical protein